MIKKKIKMTSMNVLLGIYMVFCDKFEIYAVMKLTKNCPNNSFDPILMIIMDCKKQRNE